jgi:hypothetical protein
MEFAQSSGVMVVSGFFPGCEKLRGYGGGCACIGVECCGGGGG